MYASRHCRSRSGHTLMELVVATVASGILLAGLGSVMLIARQIAYTPSAAARRTQSSEVVNAISEELRDATLVLQQTSRILEFIVSDRNADGTAEKIRYEWSGTPGHALYKTVNGGSAVSVAQNVQQFQLDYSLVAKSTTLQAIVESSEGTLASFSGGGTPTESVGTANWVAQHVDPGNFPATIGGISKSTALAWSPTRVTFVASNAASFAVELREAGEFNGAINLISHRVNLAAANANQATFSATGQRLSLARKHALVFRPDSSTSVTLSSRNSSGARTVYRSADSGATWTIYPDRQVFCTLYGTYAALGSSYNVTRNCVARVRLRMRTGNVSHARIDASIPLSNAPELLAMYWRTDFDANPTTVNANGDEVADWAQPSGSFNTSTLVDGTWRPAAALETRPLHDFTTVTTVEARGRNTTVNGNGAVLRINADRQGGQYAPLLVYLQLQPDGTQTLTLNGKTSDANTTRLFVRQRLSSELIRFRLTILPQHNVVNLAINGEDQGTFSYPTYAPTSTTDRYLSLSTDVSQSEFDYVETRVGTN